jgi:cytochrome bd ubiquinol oxidase subunit II
MHAAWFGVLALMLTAYAVLDGFDFGAGIAHLFVARTDAERRTVFAAIGPLWDGNEVWLLASGGVLVFAFPRAYAAAFSGLYLALMLILWLLVLRGVSIEFRSKGRHPLWSAAWDTVFGASSGAMALVLGVGIGNVVRGVPIDGSGYFHEDLFAGLRSAHSGAIDPYTITFGLLGLVTFGAHGATFLRWKTSGSLGARSAAAGRLLWPIAVGLMALATVLTALLEPAFSSRLLERPWLWPLPVVAAASAWISWSALSGGSELRAFAGSCAYIASMLVATAGALYPTLLRSTVDDAFTLDVTNAASGSAGLTSGLVIWAAAIVLAIGYFAYLFRSFRGKAEGQEHYD